MTPPIHISVPVIAHATRVCPTSPNHYTHTAVLCLSSTEVTNSEAHNFVRQEKQLLHTVYSDILRTTQQIQTLFSTDPSQALFQLSSLNSQLAKAIQ